MYKLIFGGLFLFAMGCPASAMIASASVNDAKSDALVVTSAFAEQRQAIEKKLADGKTYTEISSNDRSMVRDALTRISMALDSAGSVDALSEMQKTSVFNDQETINNILTKAGEDSRLICDRVAPVGSHRKITSCSTVAERRRERESSEGALRNVQRGPSLNGGG
jgi:hypothetical protein